MRSLKPGKTYKPNKADWLDGRWSHLDKKDEEYQRGETAIKPETLGGGRRGADHHALRAIAVHKTVGRLLDARKKMFDSGEGFDWATARRWRLGRC